MDKFIVSFNYNKNEKHSEESNIKQGEFKTEYTTNLRNAIINSFSRPEGKRFKVKVSRG